MPIEMEPPFDCDYCGFELEDYKTLCEHKQLHLNRPNFECLLCETKHPDQLSLKKHMRKHVSTEQHTKIHFSRCTQRIQTLTIPFVLVSNAANNYRTNAHMRYMRKGLE